MIGLFDSGVGGLSVVREVRAALPEAELIYLGDNAHVPYGARPLAEVRGFAEGITRFLRARGAEVIVVACNTASAAALRHLREQPEFAGLPFVGMEPAVKPAAETTRTGVVGVLATPATFQGELYASVVERFAAGVRVLQQTCPGLVQQIEAGALDAAETEAMLRGWVEPMLAEGIDALVLGCTHYPFVIPLLEKICGPGVRVIDPAPAVARQVGRVWEAAGSRRQKAESGRQAATDDGGETNDDGRWTHAIGRTGDSGRPAKDEGRTPRKDGGQATKPLRPAGDEGQRLTCYTSGAVEEFRRVAGRLGVEAGEVRAATWNGGVVTAG